LRWEEEAEEASLCCKKKTHYLRQGETTQGDKLIDYLNNSILKIVCLSILCCPVTGLKKNLWIL
jgi:hypothetical protein